MKKINIGIIPARMDSSRFPGKPLAKICGIPMIGHVYFRSKMSRVLDEVYVATCDKEIFNYIESIGAKAIMTAKTHQRASDRTAEAMLKIEKDTGSSCGIVVMIQGDEPMLYPKMIEESIVPMVKDRSIQVVNLMGYLKNRKEHNDPHEIKVVVDMDNFALYFSREPIPSWRKGAKDVPMLKQVCIIPFKRDFLLKFNRLKPTILEKVESIDMLRVLGHGFKVKMALTKYQTYSVDTKADLLKVEKFLYKDKLTGEYAKKI